MSNDLIRVVRKERRFGKNLLIVAVVGWFFFMILMPVFGIVREAFSEGFQVFINALTAPEAVHSFGLTLWITAVTVVINTFFGVILAITLVKHRFHGKLLMEGLVDLPFAVSPVVAGFMFILLFGPNGWLGSWLEAGNIKIVYAFPGMLIATLFVTLPFVAREIVPVLKEFGLEQEESAYVLGASKWQTFRRVTLPSIKWGLAYGITLTVARSIGEFGAVLVVSGSIIRKTQTATLHIHQEFTDFNYVGAFSAAILLAVLSFVILTAMQHIYRRKGVD
ncbi:MAG: sulfate ABC transporter permease [Candidatus Aminicenantes bacterium]|nr:sulfate ABC transporter permease [Candidatus Aminicenantes bacterium]